jgi:hypothetical protein
MGNRQRRKKQRPALEQGAAKNLMTLPDSRKTTAVVAARGWPSRWVANAVARRLDLDQLRISRMILPSTLVNRRWTPLCSNVNCS